MLTCCQCFHTPCNLIHVRRCSCQTKVRLLTWTSEWSQNEELQHWKVSLFRFEWQLKLHEIRLSFGSCPLLPINSWLFVSILVDAATTAPLAKNHAMVQISNQLGYKSLLHVQGVAFGPFGRRRFRNWYRDGKRRGIVSSGIGWYRCRSACCRSQLVSLFHHFTGCSHADDILHWSRAFVHHTVVLSVVRLAWRRWLFFVLWPRRRLDWDLKVPELWDGGSIPLEPHRRQDPRIRGKKFLLYTPMYTFDNNMVWPIWEKDRNRYQKPWKRKEPSTPICWQRVESWGYMEKAWQSLKKEQPRRMTKCYFTVKIYSTFARITSRIWYRRHRIRSSCHVSTWIIIFLTSGASSGHPVLDPTPRHMHQ